MNALETGIYAALTAATAITDLLSGTAAVYNQLGPQNADPPYIVFNHMAEAPAWTLGGSGTPAMEDYRYQVRAVTTGGSSKVAGQIAEAVDAVLSDGTITVAGYGLQYLRRIGGVSFTETVDGRRFSHRGHIYRVMLDPS